MSNFWKAYWSLGIAWGIYRVGVGRRHTAANAKMFRETFGWSGGALKAAQIACDIINFTYETLLWPLCFVLCMIGRYMRLKKEKADRSNPGA